MADSLAGKVALITGGGSGLGLVTARLLAEQGVKVAVTDIDEKAPATFADWDDAIRPLAIRADNRVVDQVRQSVAYVEGVFGSIDILVNNAGVSGKAQPLEIIEEAGFDAMFDTHVKGAFFATQAVSFGMKKRKFGRIINIGSQLAMVGTPRASHYVGAKSALHGLTRIWALELGPFGITVNTVAPGLLETPMTRDSVGVEEIHRRGASYPLGRVPTVEEVAESIVYVAGAASLTGQVISPNAGAAIVGL